MREGETREKVEGTEWKVLKNKFFRMHTVVYSTIFFPLYSVWRGVKLSSG